MPRIAYFDCFSGASGDMILGALLDSGLDFEALRAELAKIALPEDAFSVEARKVQRAGFAATKLDVIVNETPHHRSLGEVLGIVNASQLPEADRQRVARIFQHLGEVEA